jgi:hypothetical protein
MVSPTLLNLYMQNCSQVSLKMSMICPFFCIHTPCPRCVLPMLNYPYVSNVLDMFFVFCLEVSFVLYIVAYLFKARSVEAEKQQLLANGSETTFISRQQPRNSQQNNVHC